MLQEQQEQLTLTTQPEIHSTTTSFFSNTYRIPFVWLLTLYHLTQWEHFDEKTQLIHARLLLTLSRVNQSFRTFILERPEFTFPSSVTKALLKPMEIALRHYVATYEGESFPENCRNQFFEAISTDTLKKCAPYLARIRSFSQSNSPEPTVLKSAIIFAYRQFSIDGLPPETYLPYLFSASEVLLAYREWSWFLHSKNPTKNNTNKDIATAWEKLALSLRTFRDNVTEKTGLTLKFHAFRDEIAHCMSWSASPQLQQPFEAQSISWLEPDKSPDFLALVTEWNLELFQTQYNLKESDLTLIIKPLVKHVTLLTNLDHCEQVMTLLSDLMKTRNLTKPHLKTNKFYDALGTLLGHVMGRIKSLVQTPDNLKRLLAACSNCLTDEQQNQLIESALPGCVHNVEHLLECLSFLPAARHMHCLEQCPEVVQNGVDLSNILKTIHPDAYTATYQQYLNRLQQPKFFQEFQTAMQQPTGDQATDERMQKLLIQIETELKGYLGSLPTTTFHFGNTFNHFKPGEDGMSDSPSITTPSLRGGDHS